MYQQRNNMGYKSADIKSTSISFETEIKLGNPKHQCQSFGICKIEPSLHKKSNWANRNRLVNAKVVFENNRLVFFFKKAKMTKTTEQLFFGGPFFIVLSAIETPLFISEKLGISYTIDVGQYPITEKEDFYKVVF